MQVSGKVIWVGVVVTGEGRNGRWKNRDFTISTFDQYPKNVCFQISGNLVDTLNLQENDEVTVDFNVESREWQGRWFTTLKAWKVGRYISETEKYQEKKYTATPSTPDVRYDPNITQEDSDGDLPF